MENPIKLDDLGVPLFLETPRCTVMQQLLVTRITKIGLLQQLRCTGCQGLGDGKPHKKSDWIPKADSNSLKCLHVSRKVIWNETSKLDTDCYIDMSYELAILQSKITLTNRGSFGDFLSISKNGGFSLLPTFSPRQRAAATCGTLHDTLLCGGQGGEKFR